ncbi:tRNA modification GTPase MnmE [Bienertia sinuspersici]
MVTAINQGPKGYKAPSSEKARTTLLDETKKSVERELAPMQDTWYTQGTSIVSYGWSNVKHDPLINVIAANSRGAMFMYAGDFAGVEKNGDVIAEYLLKAIEEIGPSNVIQVVTDNAANCVAAGREIEKVHNHIFWSPCVVHTLNLVFKDLAKKVPWMGETYIRGKTVVKFFNGHQHVATLFKAKSTKILLKVAKTRFACMYIMLKRMLDVREALVTTIVIKAWRDWLAKQDVQTGIQGLSFKCYCDHQAHLETAEFCDGDGPKMGEIYERMDNLVGEVEQDDNTQAYALCPRFYDPKYLEAPAPGGFTRKTPNLDREVMKGCMDAFEKIGENSTEKQMLRDQFVDFQMKKGMFSLPQSKTDVVVLEAIEWWSLYGSQTPELAEVAKKVLSQPRNKLLSSRADKLVYIYYNLRLTSRLTKAYQSGPYKKWDVNPDNPGLEDSLAELEDLRWQSLDGDFDEEGGRNASGSSAQVEESVTKRPRIDQVYTRGGRN